MVNAQLPDGASLDRTDKIVEQLSKRRRDAANIPGVCAHDRRSRLLDPAEHQHQQRRRHVRHPQAVRGAEGRPRAERPGRRRQAAQGLRGYSRMHGSPCSAPRPIDGLGSTGGFKLQVQDTRGAGLSRPARRRARTSPIAAMPIRGLVGLFSSFTVNQPQLFVDIDREKLKAQKVSLDDVISHAAGLSRRPVRQRLYVLQPQLAGERPGRRPATACASRISAGWRSATPTGNRVPLQHR